MKKYDEQLERLQSLKDEPLTPALIAEVRKALGNKSNYLVGKAAQVASHHRITELIPDLVQGLARFRENAVKTDPQCWAKKAIVKALAELGYVDDPQVYISCLRFVQNEPVWGGTTDTAGPVRSLCAVALLECRSLPDTALLAHLLPTLVDGDKDVRIEGARTIANVNRAEASLLLRLKALTGDSEPEVVGACLSGVLSVERESGVEFVAGFLNGDREVMPEAALALGLARLPEAVTPLSKRYRSAHTTEEATVLMTALAVSHQSKAIDFLLDVIESENREQACSAIDALMAARIVNEELAGRIREAARANDDGAVERRCDSVLPDHP